MLQTLLVGPMWFLCGCGAFLSSFGSWWAAEWLFCWLPCLTYPTWPLQPSSTRSHNLHTCPACKLPLAEGFQPLAVIMPWLFSCHSGNLYDRPPLFCDLAPVLKLACSDTEIVEKTTFLLASLRHHGAFVLTVASYIHIVAAVLRIPSAAGKRRSLLHLLLPPHSGHAVLWNTGNSVRCPCSDPGCCPEQDLLLVLHCGHSHGQPHRTAWETRMFRKAVRRRWVTGIC